MTDPSTQPASALDDLTARARIRDAALALFAERGFAASSIREIAKAAGVSPGLVQHHFGTKDALREACDAHAVVTFRETRQSTFQVERLADPGFVAAAYARTLPVVRYLARALAEGSRERRCSSTSWRRCTGRKWRRAVRCPASRRRIQRPS
jgi:AcrR family transcriptional regulator